MSSFPEQIIERLKELRDQIRYYGLILGGTLIGLEIIFFFIQSNISILNILLFFVVKVGALFIVSSFIVKKIKPEFFKRGMSYPQSFSLILRLFLYGALFLGIYTFVFNQWIHPNYQSEVMENTISYFQSYVENVDIPNAQLELFEDRIEDMKEQPTATPLQAMWGQIWSYITWGIIVGLILSIFTRDKNITPFDNMPDAKQEQ